LEKYGDGIVKFMNLDKVYNKAIFSSPLNLKLSFQTAIYKPTANIVIFDHNLAIISGWSAWTLTSRFRSDDDDPGFWQYGQVSWATLHTWLNGVPMKLESLSIFSTGEDELSLSRRPKGGAFANDSPELVPVGYYIMLKPGSSQPSLHLISTFR
jgi:hypothetical protein